MPPTVEPATGKPKVFISYARSDGATLADELYHGLRLADFEPYLDHHDIANAEEWESRLGDLIHGADTVVFLLTPAAVRSLRCAWEVEHAAKLGKRLIPVTGKPVPETEVPERLRRLNYTIFREGQSFARPLSELATALRQDIGWIREHTRLTDAAARWQAREVVAGGGEDLLLRGASLSEARDWAARRPADAPTITPMLREFLDASETLADSALAEARAQVAERERLVVEAEQAQAAVRGAQARTRRVQRLWAAGLGLLLVLVIAATGAGLWTVFEGWRDVMRNRSQFIAGVVEQHTTRGDHVGAMLIGLDALPDPHADGARHRVLKLEHTAWNALDTAWRNWAAGWGERAVLWGHAGTVTKVAFSPDGARVLTGSWDNTARVREVFPTHQALITAVKAAVPRCLTPQQREAAHLATPPPRWCHARGLYPFSPTGAPYPESQRPPHGPHPKTWDESLATWLDWAADLWPFPLPR